MVGIEAAREGLERDVRSLVGQRLVGVAYYEVRNDGDLAFWDRQPDFDTLDYGLELRFSSGDRCWVSWGNDFYTYALKVELNTSEDRGRMRERDASQTRWSGLLGRRIAIARIYWDWQQVGDDAPRWGPQDLELTFDGGELVFISSLVIEPGRDPFGQTDTITVFFDADVARRYPVGPFTSTPNMAPAGSSSSGLIG